MAKGILYIMTTVVDGLIKIGKCQTNQFETRMQYLESNGYRNITGLKRKFAIEVEDYDEKESLLDNIFERSRLSKTELFALDSNLAVQLLSAFEGVQIFPKPEIQTKSDIFEEASDIVAESNVPNGRYYLKRKVKAYGKTIQATMDVKDGKFIVLAGSDICPFEDEDITKKYKSVHDKRVTASISNDKLLQNVEFNYSSPAAVFVIGKSENGRLRWKNKDGISIAELIKPDDNEDESV